MGALGEDTTFDDWMEEIAKYSREVKDLRPNPPSIFTTTKKPGLRPGSVFVVV